MDRKKRVSKSRRVRVTKAPSRAIKVQSKILNKVQKNAFDRLSWVKARDTNLYVDSNLLRKGTTINASHQRIRLQRDTVMVFADDAPLYNWGHPCRYLLYDGKSGELYSKTNAEFPPNLAEPEATLKAFHQPVAAVREARYRVAERLDWATLAGAKLKFYVRGKRFAVLFSGASNNRHTNDLEFLYRALIDVYGFDPNNVYVLNYDGGINYSGSPKPVGNWPGDDTAYRMPVHAAGTKAELENVFDDLKTRLGRDDLLFVHTNNHGGHNGTESYLSTYSTPSPSFLLIKSNSSISFYGKRLHDCIPYPKTAYSPSSDLKLTATVAELRMSWSMWFVFAHFSLDACGDKWSPLHRWHSTRKEPS